MQCLVVSTVFMYIIRLPGIAIGLLLNSNQLHRQQLLWLLELWLKCWTFSTLTFNWNAIYPQLEFKVSLNNNFGWGPQNSVRVGDKNYNSWPNFKIMYLDQRPDFCSWNYFTLFPMAHLRFWGSLYLSCHILSLLYI